MFEPPIVGSDPFLSPSYGKSKRKRRNLVHHSTIYVYLYIIN